MTMDTDEFAEKSAIQESLRGVGVVEETAQDRVLREAMVVDPLIIDFLSGDLFKVLDGLRTWVVAAQKYITQKQTYDQLLYLLDKLDGEWQRTKRFRPYLLLMSHLTSLTNISESQCAKFCRQVDIITTRDLIDTPEDEIETEDINFLHALKIEIHLRFLAAVEGWNANILTEQRKRIYAEVRSSDKKKRGFLRGRLL